MAITQSGILPTIVRVERSVRANVWSTGHPPPLPGHTVVLSHHLARCAVTRRCYPPPSYACRPITGQQRRAPTACRKQGGLQQRQAYAEAAHSSHYAPAAWAARAAQGPPQHGAPCQRARRGPRRDSAPACSPTSALPPSMRSSLPCTAALHCRSQQLLSLQERAHRRRLQPGSWAIHWPPALQRRRRRLRWGQSTWLGRPLGRRRVKAPAQACRASNPLPGWRWHCGNGAEGTSTGPLSMPARARRGGAAVNPDTAMRHIMSHKSPGGCSETSTP